MRKLYVLGLFLAVAVAIVLAGCSGALDNLPLGISPTPEATHNPLPPATPTPEPTPEATPTPTPVPIPLANAHPSNMVHLITSTQKYEIVTAGMDSNGRQFENISVIVANDDTQPVRNVVLIVRLTSGPNSLLYQEVPVGDLAAGERKPLNILTETHEPSTVVKVDIQARWGDYGEYYNPNALYPPVTFSHV